MKSVYTTARIESGKLKIAYRDRFTEAIKALPDGRYKLTLEKVYNKRSLPQNSFLHGVVIPEVRLGMIEAGYSPAECSTESVKDFLKFRFAKKEIINVQTGEVFETIEHTSEMSTARLNEFIEEIRVFAAEYLNHEIPEPNEQLRFDNFNN